jgi:hypothetical protein
VNICQAIKRQFLYHSSLHNDIRDILSWLHQNVACGCLDTSEIQASNVSPGQMVKPHHHRLGKTAASSRPDRRNHEAFKTTAYYQVQRFGLAPPWTY